MKNKLYSQVVIFLCILIFLGASVGTSLHTTTEQDENINHPGLYLSSQTFNPTDDSLIGNIYDSNEGAADNIGIRNGGEADYWIVSTVLKFNISLLPVDAIVKSASVNLYYYRNVDNDANGRALNMYRFESDWNEETIVRSNMPSVSSGISSIAHAPSSAGVWVSWDVTSDVQQFLSGSLQNYGWIINDEQYWGGFNIPYMQFRSKEYGSNIPNLDVQLLDLKQSFLFGRITNLTSHENYITFSAVKLHCLRLSPFSYNTYQSGETLAVSTQKIGILNTNLAFGKFNAALY